MGLGALLQKEEKLMKLKYVLVLFSLILCLPLSACADKLKLDETTISLVMGIDKGEKDKFTIFQSNPVFSEEAQESTDIIQVEAATIREARKKLDSHSSGNVLTRKLQVLLISKEVLKETGIFPHLDVFYRDPKNAINARIAVVDGTIKEVIEFNPKDKPRLSIYLSELIDTTKRNESTVRTTFQRFTWQNYEKGITPMLTEIKLKKDEFEVTGTALLRKNGLYAMSLTKDESALLLLMRKKFEYPVPLTLRLNNEDKKEGQQTVSFDIHNVSYQVDTKYNRGKFNFIIDLEMEVLITENNSDFKADDLELSEHIAKAFKRDLDQLIKKVQDQELAPFGLGVHARAFEYNHWKEVEDDWPKALSEAEISVNTKVKIKGSGIVK